MNVSVETLLQIIGRMAVEKEMLIRQIDELTRKLNRAPQEDQNENA